MRLGPFYLDTKELFLIILAGLVFYAKQAGWDIPYFDETNLLMLVVLFFLAKGLLPAIHNENFLILALVTLFLSFYLVPFQLLLFFLIALTLFRVMKVI